MTVQEMVELKRLEQQATPPPWVMSDVLLLEVDGAHGPSPTRIDRTLAAAARNALPRLLHEVERERLVASLPLLSDEMERRDTAVAGAAHCNHQIKHVVYCSGCCARFDPARMLLIHENACPFRSHERAGR